MCTDFTFYRIFLHCLYPSNSPVIKKRRIFISLLYRYIHKLIISWQSQITMIAIGCCSDHNLALSGFCFCPSPQMSISSNRGLEWGCVQREAICSKRSSRALSSRQSRCLRWGLERSMCGRTTHMKMHTSGKGWSLLRPMWLEPQDACKRANAGADTGIMNEGQTSVRPWKLNINLRRRDSWRLCARQWPDLIFTLGESGMEQGKVEGQWEQLGGWKDHPGRTGRQNALRLACGTAAEAEGEGRINTKRDWASGSADLPEGSNAMWKPKSSTS